MDKIKYCTNSFLEEFKTNFDMYISLYKTKDKYELNNIFKSSDNVREGKQYFEFKPLLKHYESDNSERENIKIIYESLRNLTPSEAIQEKLWVAMYNTYYQDHLFDYIDLNIRNKNIDKKIKSSIFYTHGENRSRIVQNIARMWWIGYLLYDSDNENPYELLDFYTDTKDIIGKSTTFLSSTLTNNKNLLFGIIDGIKELTELGIIENNRYYYVLVNKRLNILGGTVLLDYFTREEIKKLTIKYITEDEETNI